MMLAVMILNELFEKNNEKPHRHLVTFRGGKWIRLTLTSLNTWFHGHT